MSVKRICTQCGSVLAMDGLAGLCPECLLREGFDSRFTGPNSTTGVTGFVPPSPAELAPRFPQFEIIELLGKGGMGAVYKARQYSLNRLVALKILPPEVGEDPAFAERFAREARSLAMLSHQNIVAVHDFGQTKSDSPGATDNATYQEIYYFVMEYVEGANIRQLMQQGRLTLPEALAIVPQICEALQFAHEEGIVHRDIKPENILVDKRGRVKIADFGLAKLLRVQPIDVTLTAADQVMGTWHYMAPEQMERPTHVDHRADLYSLGVVFYEMLTGRLPLGHFEPPSSRASVDVRLDQVVMRALEREPERRYQLASDIKTDVEAIGAVERPGGVGDQVDRRSDEPSSGADQGSATSPSAAATIRGDNSASTIVDGRLHGIPILSGLSSEEREAMFGEMLALAAMLGLLTLVWFGMWITGSTWFVLALFLPWVVLGVTAAVDERESTSVTSWCSLALALLGSMGVLGHGIWLAKSGWPLLAIVMPFIGLLIGVGIIQLSSDEEKKDESAEKNANGDSEDSEDWGYGTFVLTCLFFLSVVMPLFWFVSDAMTDLSQVLIDAFEMDQRLQRPVLILIWGALCGGLAYAGFAIWQILRAEKTSEFDTEAEAAMPERDWSQLARVGTPLLVLLILVGMSLRVTNRRQTLGNPSETAEAPITIQTREWLELAATDDVSQLRRLLEQGMDVNAVDPDTGETALMRAAASGNTSAVAILMLRRGNEQARDQQGKTPLMHAVEHGQREVVQLLRDLEQIHWNDKVQFRVARLDAELPADADFPSMRFHVAIDAQDAQGQTALMKAAARGDAEMVETLALASRRLRDHEGRTALAHAVLSRQTSFLRLAIEQAESLLPGHSDGHGYVGFVTPDVLAIADSSGKTPLQLAEELGLDDIAERMRRYLASVIELESRAMEKRHGYLWYSYYIRGLCRQTLGDSAQGEADLAKSRELQQR
jgi:serine/threonine protein kinase/ankyrin repeat protein